MNKVTYMKTETGNCATTQFTFETDKGRYFQSYASIVVFIPLDGKPVLDINKWDSSFITSKYRNTFLNTTTKELLQDIKAGLYEFKDLNDETD